MPSARTGSLGHKSRRHLMGQAKAMHLPGQAQLALSLRGPLGSGWDWTPRRLDTPQKWGKRWGGQEGLLPSPALGGRTAPVCIQHAATSLFLWGLGQWGTRGAWT